jgi:hypothetical protein
MNSQLLYLMSQMTVIGAPAARVHRTTSELIATSGSATLSPVWDTIDFAANNAVATSSGISVPLQGYYLVNANATFSSVPSGTYEGPVLGAVGYISIFNGTDEMTRGIAIGQSNTNSQYASSATDILYVEQGGTLTAQVFGSTPSGSIYLWSASDLFSSYFSLAYICA